MSRSGRTSGIVATNCSRDAAAPGFTAGGASEATWATACAAAPEGRPPGPTTLVSAARVHIITSACAAFDDPSPCTHGSHAYAGELDRGQQGMWLGVHACALVRQKGGGGGRAHLELHGLVLEALDSAVRHPAAGVGVAPPLHLPKGALCMLRAVRRM